MRFPWVSRKRLEETEREYSRALFEAIQAANKAAALCEKYQMWAERAPENNKSEIAQLEKERDLANIRLNQLAAAFHRLQLRHQDYFN